MRDAGLEVDFHETGSRLDLKPGAELAVFRILQEALENALKHGGPGTQARVTFTWTDEGLEVLVDDDGIRADALAHGLDPDLRSPSSAATRSKTTSRPSRSRRPGAGITEMRERTELFGGVFTATRCPGSDSRSRPSSRPCASTTACTA